MKDNEIMPQGSSFEDWAIKNEGIIRLILPLTEEEKAQAKADSENNLRNHKDQFGPSKFYSSEYAEYWAKRNGLDVDQAKKTTAEAKNRAMDYHELVLGSKPKRKQSFSPKFDQLMELKEAKKIFWNGYLSKSFENEYPKRKYEIDNDNMGSIAEMVKYFICDSSCVFKLHKGICLIGGVGTGKSNLMHQFSRFTKDQGLDTAFDFVNFSSVKKEIQTFGLRAIDKYMTGDLCFDEMKPVLVNSHGTKISVSSEIIEGREKRFTKLISRPTHFTSNIDLDYTIRHFNGGVDKEATKAKKEELAEKYGLRAVDRIGAMCNFVYLGGPSRRK